MKKIIILVIVFLLIGCSIKKEEEKDKITSIIEQQENIVISIHYPITGIFKLDQKLKEDTNEIYQNFKNEYESFHTLDYRSELNIGYTLKEINERYLNITLSIFLDSGELAHPENDIKTYVFDKKQNKILTMEDLFSLSELKKLKTELQLQLIQKYKECLLLDQMKGNLDDNFSHYNLFTFTDTTLTIYKNPYEVTSGNCGIISLEVPISNFHLKIPLTKDVFKEKFTTPVEPTKKIIDPKKPVIALTFDDGPSSYTKEIIDFLKEQNANATFFVIGNKVEAYQELIRESIKNGNEIGNHSYSHKDLSKLDVTNLKAEIEKTQQILFQTTGYIPKLLRPTYGEKNKQILENTNLKVTLWDVDPKDWSKKSSTQIANHILSKVKNRDIILLHDTKKRSLEAVKIIVPKLIEQGYQFITVSELEEVKLLNQR